MSDLKSCANEIMLQLDNVRRIVTTGDCDPVLICETASSNIRKRFGISASFYLEDTYIRCNVALQDVTGIIRYFPIEDIVAYINKAPDVFLDLWDIYKYSDKDNNELHSETLDEKSDKPKKYIIVINGKGGSGKDALIVEFSSYYDGGVKSISSIDCIKDLARQVGWFGGKSDKSRKFLSDLKRACADFNDYPTKSIYEKATAFICDSVNDILFVHIREPLEIIKFVNLIHAYKESTAVCEDIDVRTYTLLIERPIIASKVYGNDSDDNVSDYDYDFVYTNNIYGENEAGKDFTAFLKSKLSIQNKK